jgi:hypothetical protein
VRCLIGPTRATPRNFKVTSDANSAVCTYLVTIWSTGQARSEVDPLSAHSDSDFLSGTAPGFPPPAPLNSAIMRQQPAGWWNSLPEGSYNSSKMSIATDPAQEQL